MAVSEHFEILNRGASFWNSFRYNNLNFVPDLSGADLSNQNLREYDLHGADLHKANLNGCNLVQATLTRANLADADLTQATLHRAYLLGAKAPNANFYAAQMRDAQMAGINLENAQLQRADMVHCRITSAQCSYASFANAKLEAALLNQTNFTGATFIGADLSNASVNQTCFAQANLDRSRIYGISVWDVDLDGTTQNELIITPKGDLPISVDNLEVAQFVYLILNNSKLREVIDTVTTKVVLILGRFTEERKTVLDRVRDSLRHLNLLPILFDFNKPSNKDLTGTIETLASLARFIFVDISEPASVPHELATIVPRLRTTPVLSIKQVGASSYSMFEDLRAYPWVLPTHHYTDQSQLLKELPNIIEPALNLRGSLRKSA